MPGGPRPTPTAILEARGSWRAALRDKEPVLPTGIQEAPKWISRGARKYWREHVRKLAAMRVMTEADTTALTTLCEALLMHEKARGELQKAGLTLQGKNGLQRHPAVGIVLESWNTIMRLCREFGFTPAARTGLRVEPIEEKHNEPEDPKRFLGGLGAAS